MLKLLLPMTAALNFAVFALPPTEAKAACNPDHYLMDAVTAANKELGEQIGCLAETLPKRGEPMSENNQKTAEKIIRLSYKIIGNGEAPASQLLAGAVTVSPGGGSDALKRDTDAAKKIACLASGYLTGPSVEPDLLKYRDTCPGIDDPRAEILVAGKIIGNG